MNENNEIIEILEKNIIILFNQQEYQEAIKNCLILLDREENNVIGGKYLSLCKDRLKNTDYWEKMGETIDSIFNFSDVVNVIFSEETSEVIGGITEVIISVSQTTGEVLVEVGGVIVEVGAGIGEILLNLGEGL